MKVDINGKAIKSIFLFKELFIISVAFILNIKFNVLHVQCPGSLEVQTEPSPYPQYTRQGRSWHIAEIQKLLNCVTRPLEYHSFSKRMFFVIYTAVNTK